MTVCSRVGECVLEVSWRGRCRILCYALCVSCPLIGLPASFVLRHFLCLGLPFFPLPVLVFLVFLGFASSAGYWSMRALLPERVEPFGRASSSASSQSAKSCCWSQSCAWFMGHVVPEGGIGSCPFPVASARASAVQVVVWAEDPDTLYFAMLG